ncbi:putative ADP-ribose pyrophosphatase [Methanobrevibacter arboriphilus JCM 13429 = DSM 1125]|uniref:Putative ADP-ribose pyrophosphatase n=1 Tax=Methanobrevibacter arboriphilus JCM 13429 = DSM 1125 TaxID=1300164 RepID=A0A1V6N462_METAZ|nr:NUDIX domain-containing protein [Methanobrevibacter arboriphilus]OQD59459.1 putative ADP-ribose pyrophosphatase [Methanobrevibacter arboriphilus JCM 13429 = DSM 1125]
MKKPYGLVMRGLLKKDGKILLLKRHPNSKTNPSRWELPGGKVEPGEDFDKALIREFNEETNLSIELNDLIGAVQEDFPHKKTIAVVMNVDITSEIPEVKISNEHVDFKWADIEEIKDLEISGWFKTLMKEKNYSL